MDPRLSDTELNFMMYLGWKALGWAVVFLGVLLLLRFVKVWLLHEWSRESATTRQLERARAEALQEICARMRANRIRRQHQHQQQQQGSQEGGARQVEEVEDSPPTYEAVVNTSALAAASSDDGDGVGDGVAAGEVKLCITPPDCEDEELPPDYASLFRQKKMNGH